MSSSTAFWMEEKNVSALALSLELRGHNVGNLPEGMAISRAFALPGCVKDIFIHYSHTRSIVVYRLL